MSPRRDWVPAIRVVTCSCGVQTITVSSDQGPWKCACGKILEFADSEDVSARIRAREPPEV